MRQSIECPFCGSSQEESSLVISTHCRSCGAYYKIKNGKAVTGDIAYNPQFKNTSAEDYPNKSDDKATSENPVANNKAPVAQPKVDVKPSGSDKKDKTPVPEKKKAKLLGILSKK